MEIQYYGANCLRLSTKKASIVVDDTVASIGGKSPTKAGDVALFTTTPSSVNKDVKIVIDEPGEFEVSDISVQGIAARAHMDEEGKKSATMYKVIIDDVRVAIVGHVYPKLSGSQLEALGVIDVLIIPVGGNGYTLDSLGALKLIKEIEPKLIIPTHYADKSLNYEVPQQTLDDALKGLSMESTETVPKLKIKSGEFSEGTQLAVLEKQ